MEYGILVTMINSVVSLKMIRLMEKAHITSQMDRLYLEIGYAISSLDLTLSYLISLNTFVINLTLSLVLL